MQDMKTPTAPDVDIAGMDFVQLSALRERIEERVREMREGLSTFNSLAAAAAAFVPGNLVRWLCW